MGVGTSRPVSALYMVIFGIGLGFLFQNVMVIAQNSVEPKDIGAASGTLTFFRSIGGTFGVSLFAAVFASRLHDELARTLSPTPAADRLPVEKCAHRVTGPASSGQRNGRPGCPAGARERWVAPAGRL